MAQALIDTKYIPDHRIHKPPAKMSPGTYLALFMNIIISLLWGLFGFTMMSEIAQSDLTKAVWYPKAYLTGTTQVLKYV